MTIFPSGKQNWTECWSHTLPVQ